MAFNQCKAEVIYKEEQKVTTQYTTSTSGSIISAIINCASIFLIRLIFRAQLSRLGSPTHFYDNLLAVAKGLKATRLTDKHAFKWVALAEPTFLFLFWLFPLCHSLSLIFSLTAFTRVHSVSVVNPFSFDLFSSTSYHPASNQFTTFIIFPPISPMPFPQG